MEKRNWLLQALPRDVHHGLRHNQEHMWLARGTILHRPGEIIKYLYFPLDCLVSITITMAGGQSAETGVVGNREVVGINAFMGGAETTQTEYVVQVDGEALRIDARPLREAFDTNKAVRDVFLKYTQAMIAHVSQNAACNRLHELEQRYARWLLEVRHRIYTDELRLTQEFIGEMLGVPRASVTHAAAAFEQRGLIRQERGLTRILDPEGVQQAACECYAVVRDEYDRLLQSGG